MASRVSPFDLPPTTRHPLIVDGGLATALEAAGHTLHPTLWSAGVFLENPSAVEGVHRSFLDAGADILITASYQMAFDNLAAEGIDRARAADAMTRTVEVARTAVGRSGREAFVAASIGPYGATRADGSEYTGRYDIGLDGLVGFHGPRLEVLREAGPDLLAVETVPCLVEARAMARLLDGPGPEAWVSFCCRDDGHLSDGTPIAEAAGVVAGLETVRAIGINCTAPEHVVPLMEEVRRVTPKPLVVYPNSGERWDASNRRWTGEAGPEPIVDRAAGWARLGAVAIGGCCRVGPRTIEALSRMFRGRDDPS